MDQGGGERAKKSRIMFSLVVARIYFSSSSTPPPPAPLAHLAGYGFVNNNLVEAPPGGDFKRRGVLGVHDGDELGNEALDLGPVKATNRIRVVE